MDDNHQLILVAAYGDLDAAHTDFGELERRLKHGMELRSAALVTRDDQGNAEVVEAANRHGRSGALIGAGIFCMLLSFDDFVRSFFLGGYEPTLPVLMSYGARDIVVPAKGVARTAKELPSHVRTVYYENGYHMLLRDLQAEKVHTDYLSFMRSPASALPSGAGEWPFR